MTTDLTMQNNFNEVAISNRPVMESILVREGRSEPPVPEHKAEDVESCNSIIVLRGLINSSCGYTQLLLPQLSSGSLMLCCLLFLESTPGLIQCINVLCSPIETNAF